MDPPKNIITYLHFGFLKHYQPHVNRTYPSAIKHMRVIVTLLWSGKDLIFNSHNNEFES